MTAIHYKNYRRAIADNAMDNKKQAEDEITNYIIIIPKPGRHCPPCITPERK